MLNTLVGGEDNSLRTTDTDSTGFRGDTLYVGERDAPIWRLRQPCLLLEHSSPAFRYVWLTTYISRLVGISITLSQIFSEPPYDSSVITVGCTDLSACVAWLLGIFTDSPLIDGIVRKMSLRNGGNFGTFTGTPHCRLIPIVITSRARIPSTGHGHIHTLYRHGNFWLGSTVLCLKSMAGSGDSRSWLH